MPSPSARARAYETRKDAVSATKQAARPQMLSSWANVIPMAPMMTPSASRSSVESRKAPKAVTLFW